MAVQQLKINYRGIFELLRSDEVQAELVRRARRVAAAAGPGQRVESEVGKRRARAAVITDTAEARVAESKSRNLTRAFGAARG